jgi:long-chain acyl-CoA synthetase
MRAVPTGNDSTTNDDSGCALAALRDHAAAHPDKTAVALGDRALGYAELWQRASAAARLWRELGVGAGDRVLVSAVSCPEFAIAYFATHLARAVNVPIAANAPAPRVREIAARTQPKLTVGCGDAAAQVGLSAAAIELAALGALDTGAALAELPHDSDVADLLFTSGTTGRAKGVVLTHGNLRAATAGIRRVIGNGPDDVEVVTLPLAHSFGLGRLRGNVLAGGSVVLCEGARLPGEIFGALALAGATGLSGVPACFALLLRFGAEGLGLFARQLRYVEIGSAPMPIAHKRALMRLLPNTALWMHYGSTEASRSAFLEFHRDRERLQSVGSPRDGVEASVRDEAGAALPAYEPGTLWLRAATVASGYWDDPDLTARTFEDGFVCTGDLAHLDGAGTLFVHGRRDDMIDVGGYGVSPDEVERALCEHPAIAEAACVGVPDPSGIVGHKIRAFVVAARGTPQPPARELSQWLAGRLEAYKIPSAYEWLTELPQTDSGKIRRAELRARASRPRPE